MLQVTSGTYVVIRVTTWLENLEMSSSYTDVREMSPKVLELSGENLVMVNCQKWWQMSVWLLKISIIVLLGWHWFLWCYHY